PPRRWPAPSRTTRAFAWANPKTTSRSPAVGDRQILDAVDPSRPEALGLTQFGDVGDLICDLVEDQLDLHPREVRTDAEMRAVAAEGQMRVGVAQDVEFEGLVEDLFVVVGRAVEQADALPGLDRDVAHADVGQGGPLETVHRRGPADNLV